MWRQGAEIEFCMGQNPMCDRDDTYYIGTTASNHHTPLHHGHQTLEPEEKLNWNPEMDCIATTTPMLHK